jgi:hypothetical protein
MTPLETKSACMFLQLYEGARHEPGMLHQPNAMLNEKLSGLVVCSFQTKRVSFKIPFEL